MKVLRWLLGALGVAAFAVAVGVVVSPTMADAVPLEGVVEALGNDYFLVAAFGALALALTLVAIAIRAVRGLDQATPPDPEDVQTAPRLGESFDDLVENGFGLRARLFGDEADRARDRVRSTAVTVHMRAANCSRSAAERAVENGTWTDDRAAAAFLGGVDGPSPGLSGRARAALRGESWFQYGLRRSATAIVDASNGRTLRETAAASDDVPQTAADRDGGGGRRDGGGQTSGSASDTDGSRPRRRGTGSEVAADD